MSTAPIEEIHFDSMDSTANIQFSRCHYRLTDINKGSANDNSRESCVHAAALMFKAEMSLSV